VGGGEPGMPEKCALEAVDLKVFVEDTGGQHSLDVILVVVLSARPNQRVF
jgi:hypothetical protein